MMRTNNKGVKMVGMTRRDRQVVWRRDGDKPFLLSDRGVVHELGPWARLRYRRVPPPHLSYEHVEVAEGKARTLLAALTKGPLYRRKGFLYDRSGKLVMTRKMAGVVLKWMGHIGWVFTASDTVRGTMIDLDVRACQKNGVLGKN